MLTNKQKKKLKSIANTSSNKYQIGKAGVDNDVVALLNNALRAHELIKVYFNKSIVENIDSFVNEIVKCTNSDLVGQIGHMVILYKENKDKKDRIIL